MFSIVIPSLHATISVTPEGGYVDTIHEKRLQIFQILEEMNESLQLGYTNGCIVSLKTGVKDSHAESVVHSQCRV